MSEKAERVETWLQDLAQKGWTLSRSFSGESEGWCLERHEDQLYISLNPYWLCFTLPLADRDDGTSYRHDLERCHRHFLVKFSADPSAQRLLQVELPWIGLDRCHCYKAVEALSIYGDRSQGKQHQSTRVAKSKTERSNVRSLRQLEVFPQKSLVQYFQSIERWGWGLVDDLKDNRWQARYKGADRVFDVHLYFNPYWAYFQIPLSTENTQNARSANAVNQNFLYAYLLQLNEQIYWAKLGVDETGQILMMLDIPLERFDLNQFRFAAKTLATYADRLAYDIQILANLDREQQLASLMLELQQSISPNVLTY